MKRLVALLVFCFGILLCSCTPTQKAETLCITELQSAGGDADWIELCNYGTAAVNLNGWYLSNDPQSPGKSALPAAVLQPNERLVVSTSDSLAFRLSADGETVILSNPTGKTVQTVVIPASVPGLSYGCVEEGGLPPEEFVWYAAPTMGLSNNHGMMLGNNATDTRHGVRINEYVMRNKTSLYDREGNYGDWIELYNFSDKAIDLAGWSLTDEETEPQQWQFPSGTLLPAGGYLTVFCDGKDLADNGEYHTSFGLGDSDDFLALYTADGVFCSGVTCHAAAQDEAYGCDENGTVLRCRYPTPGYANAVKTEVAE